MQKKIFQCCICGDVFTGWGNNPYPVNKDENARCCNDCNSMHVIPARIAAMYERKDTDNEK